MDKEIIINVIEERIKSEYKNNVKEIKQKKYEKILFRSDWWI